MDEEEIRSIPDAILEFNGAESRGNASLDAERELKVVNSGLSSEELTTAAQRNEHNRDQHFKDVFERISIWALYGLTGGLAICAAVWVWHITVPPCWRWLDTDRLDKLQDIVTGGLLAGLIVDHFRKRMK